MSQRDNAYKAGNLVAAQIVHVALSMRVEAIDVSTKICVSRDARLPMRKAMLPVTAMKEDLSKLDLNSRVGDRTS